MVSKRTVDLLPEIFRTPANRRFLDATLDQLTQEPDLVKTRGFVGRRSGAGVAPNDRYVVEPTAERTNYQLEPAVAFLRPNGDHVRDVMTYPGLLAALAQQGADVDRQSDLWRSDFYAWDSFCDIDKLVNYSQYYWLPYGPDSVTVGNDSVPTQRTFDVTRTANDAYTFTFATGKNPKLRLVRGGNYQFRVDQSAGFWIQSEPGVNGTLSASPNISSRDVLGVINNGDDSGTVSFRVPLKTDQDFFYSLTDLGTVDLVTDLRFTDINNRYVDQFLLAHPNGIDGVTNLNDRTVIFTRTDPDVQEGGWQITTRFDPLPRSDSENGIAGSFDSVLFDQTTDLDTLSQRYAVFRISYVSDSDGQQFMQVRQVRDFPNLSRVRVRYGDIYSSTQWYKNSQGYFERIPLLTAVQDRLYYQDALDPKLFGEIELLDPDSAQPLDINDIVGAQTYVSPNGVTFTNGLKVRFDSNVVPAEFADREYYVEGVGSGPGLEQRIGFVDGSAYYGAFHIVDGRPVTGSVADANTFQQYIYDDVQTSILNRGRGTPELASRPATGISGTVQGVGIQLIPVTELITPETYTRSATVPFDVTGFDETPFDSSLNAPTVEDYITVNRASQDRNAWSRSNRWFHVDVIQAAAILTNQPFRLDNLAKARRPIIEFRANLRLFDMGTRSVGSVSLVDANETDAFSNVAGSTSYSIDGVNLMDGMRVIFAADQDPEVRNRVYLVELIDPDGEPGSPPVIRLTDTGDDVTIDAVTVTTSGITGQGITYRYDGVTWQQAQQKTNVNQPPLFDVYDSVGRSFSDTAVYVSSNFAGTRLFGYADSTSSVIDPVLGFALSYLNINNIGDIRFENYLTTDTFVYVDSANRSQTQNISTGSVRQYIDSTSFTSLIGWLPAAAQTQSRQVLRFRYTGDPLVMDVAVLDQEQISVPVIKLYANSVFVDPDAYEVSTTDKTVIRFLIEPELDSDIEAQIISDTVSRVGYFQVPLNLENNALNQDSVSFTLGSVRRHYESMAQNLTALVGNINGANNVRDLGNSLIYGQNIVQHSAPLTLASMFLRDPGYDVFAALTYNSQEYEKYKARLMDTVTRLDIQSLTVSDILDLAMSDLASGRDSASPFYWSDMLPAGEVYDETVYTVTPISTATFDTLRAYDFTVSNYQSLLVYVNDRILTRGSDYSVGTESTTITINVPLTVGDRVRIREYNTTYGNFVPNTPTKLGLYPAWRPQQFVDTTYRRPTTVIQGHDGSVTVAYGDIRDDVLLEFECRIYNNLKISDTPPLRAADVVPGRFRNTGRPLDEVNAVLALDFLTWCGWNRLDFAAQTYVATDTFTYNYNQSADRISGSLIPGAWRGINRYFYDTQDPSRTPWEMLGFTQQPIWWESVYGPAPYTQGNLVLWEDLANGIIADPENPRVDSRYQRRELLSVIPTGSEGELLDPLTAVVGNYDETSFRRSWTFGDGGPTESAWRNSSSYPFAVMRLLALTRPAQFFSLFADRDRYRYNTEFGQYLWDDRYRLDASKLGDLYGSGVSKASYINWIIDYNLTRGIDSARNLSQDLGSVDVRLTWRVAGYTDKRYLKIYTERSTPSGENLGFLLPDESYQILLYENVPAAQARYSAVIVQRTDQGWQVQGYDISRPYFEISRSRVRGTTRVISAGGASATVPTQYTDDVVRVPYGYTFTNRNSVCDFLLSYGRRLETAGIVFDTRENGYIMDWNQMCQEFLYWSNQGWVTGSLINLNPAAQLLDAGRSGLVARSLIPAGQDNLVMNQNRQVLAAPRLRINRLGDRIQLTTTGSDALSSATLDFAAYEHVIVLDNRSLFNDLIYDPVTGSRQSRVLVAGWITGSWDGSVRAPGFVLNQDNVEDWRSDRVYTKGDIVLYKDRYWSARYIIQPSEMFDFNEWLPSDYEQIRQGLLPNAALGSLQLQQAYDIYASNLESDVNLFSYGLIGFRPRQYMQALSLDDVSQVNLYQQFLGTKGTRRSAEIFTLADIGKETAEYDIYEYWAMLRGRYGATDNRRFVEILLDQSRLVSDPSLIQLIEPQQLSTADQTVLLKDLWRQSNRVTGVNIFKTRARVPADSVLPTAGYVDLEDVDLAVFDLDALDALDDTLESDLDSTAVDDIGEGTVIWVAKINDYDWNIYRCTSIDSELISASDNLDGTLRLRFNRQHGLTVQQPVIVRFFDPVVNGSHRVVTVPDLYSITITGQLPPRVTQITGNGVLFRLVSVRLSQPTDLVDLAFAGQEDTRVWVDDVGNGGWGMLENTDPFEQDSALLPRTIANASGYGTAVSQGLRNLTSLIGAPSLNDTGAVYVFVKQADDQYAEDTVLLMSTANVAGFGASVDIGSDSYAVIGAPDSCNGQGLALIAATVGLSSLTQQQILLPPDGVYANAAFGSQVTMSQDERWVYVSAPGTGRVYAYNRVDIANQTVTYRTDSSTYGNVFNYSDHVVIDSDRPGQIVVTLDDQLLQPITDFELVSGNVVLVRAAESLGDDQLLSISRRRADILDQALYANLAATSNTSAQGTGARFAVDRQRGVYSATVIQGGNEYRIGDTLTISGDVIGGATPANDLEIEVTETGEFYFTTAAVESGAVTVIVNTVQGLVIGQDIVQIGGTGVLAANTTVSSFSDDQLTAIEVSATAVANVATVRTTTSIGAVTDVGGVYWANSAPSTVDNVTVLTDDRVLVLDQADQAENGVYQVVTAGTGSDGSWQRILAGAELDDTEWQITGPLTPISRVPQGQQMRYRNTVWRLRTIKQLTLSDAVDTPGSLTFLVSPGPISAITVTNPNGGIGNTASFDLGNSFYQINGIDSVRITVDGNIYTPNIDYTMSGNVVTFVSGARFPGVGATISAVCDTHFQHVGTVTAASLGLANTVGFGEAISTTSDGRQLLIGANKTDHAGRVQSGKVYVFDRSVQAAIYQDDSDSEFGLYVAQQGPTTVRLNGQLLSNQDGNINGNFQVGIGSVTVLDPQLTPGDVIEIETNQFRLLQILEAATPVARARYGFRVDACVNDCSVYVSAPYDSQTLPEAGLVEFWNNQARVYGVIRTTQRDPELTPGDHISVNGQYIQLSQPAAWTSAVSWNRGRFVVHSGAIYEAVTTVPTGIEITDQQYWQPSSWLAVLAGDIMQPVSQGGVLNVTAQVQDGYLALAVKNASARPALDQLSVLPGTGSLFDDLGIPVYARQQELRSPRDQGYAHFGASLFISEDTRTLIVGAPDGSMVKPLTLDQGTTVFDAKTTNFADTLTQSGAVYVFDQVSAANPSVSNPNQFVFGQEIVDQSVRSQDRFGTAVDYTTGTLLIGAPGNDTDSSTQDDIGRVSQWRNPDQQPAWQLVRSQQPTVDLDLFNRAFIYDRVTNAVKQFLDVIDPLQGRILGAARQNIDYVTPVDPAAYNTGPVNNYGSAWTEDHVGNIWWDISTVRFLNANQNDVVYASRRWGQIFPGSRVELYQWVSSSVPPDAWAGAGRPKSTGSYTVKTVVDEQGIIDTRYYFWITDIDSVLVQQGKTLSINNIARYIENPRASGVAYLAAINSSTVALYNTLPLIDSQDTVLHLDYDETANQDLVHSQYHLIPVGRADGFLDAPLYAKMIDSFAGIDSRGAPVPDPALTPSERHGTAVRPRQSLFANRVQALQNYLTAANRALATFPVTENRRFTLLNSNEPEPAVSSRRDLVRMRVQGSGLAYMIVDIAYELVTAATLTVNGANVPLTSSDIVSEDGGSKTRIVFPTVYDHQDQLVLTVIGAVWNQRLLDRAELSYQDLDTVPPGYRYLIASDSDNNGLWTVYEVVNSVPRSLLLARVQTFDTRLYWQYIDWYATGYSAATRITDTVERAAQLEILEVPTGSVVKVLANSQGRSEIYVRETARWTRVGLESGTVRFRTELWDYELGRFGFDSEVFDAQYFDENPFTETRQIIRAINEELLIDDTLIERNRLLTLMLRYILSEQQAPDWLIKTSLIDVDHTIRDLVPYPIYRQDNQDFVLDYIQEVKPYHAQIREFNLKYKGSDITQQQLDDFDLPAYYDTDIDRFVSPVLDNTGELSPTSSRSDSAAIWQQWPYLQWYSNHTLILDSVVIVDAGSGYTVAPIVTVSGTAERPARLQARITSDGRVFAIEVLDAGQGYVSTPEITVTGGNGTGARAVARMTNTLVRRVKTVMRFDRYQYSSDIQDWQPFTAYAKDTRVRYADRVWQAPNAIPAGASFDATIWITVDAGSLSGLDRTQGFYAPRLQQVGRDLSQLINGIDYPGVEVQALDFGSPGAPTAVTYTVPVRFELQERDGAEELVEIDSDQTVWSFDRVAVPIYRDHDRDQLITVTVDDIPQQLGIDYTLSFQPQQQVTFTDPPPNRSQIKIALADLFDIVGDVRYQSSFTDTFLGTDPPPSYDGDPVDARSYGIEVAGGAFVDTYASHAPEELLPGSVFDTVDLRVTQTPGSDWDDNGHGFPVQSQSYRYTATAATLHWQQLQDYPATLSVTNASTGTLLMPDQDYVVAWAAGTVTVVSGASENDIIVIRVTELGGGNQLYRLSQPGDVIGETVLVPVSTALIEQIVLFVNGESQPGTIWQSVAPGETRIVLPVSYASTDLVTLVVMGSTAAGYQWSAPVTEWFLATGSLEFTLTNSTAYSNPANMIVTINGRRVRPWESAEYVYDGSSEFALPNQGGIQLSSIADNDVAVYVNDQPLRLETDFVIDRIQGETDPIGYSVYLLQPPADLARITVSVRTASPYLVIDGKLIFKPSAGQIPLPGDRVSVTTFNDTREQRLLTQVWQGPTEVSQRTGQELAVDGNLIVGNYYEIKTLGTTDFTTVGAVNNNIGTIFQAQIPSGGTGITTIQVTNSGIGYTEFPTVQIDPPPAGNSQAVAGAVVMNPGAIAEIDIDDPGLGYTANVPVTIVDVSGTGAAATAVANLNNLGTIDTISITSSGTGYSDQLTVSIPSPTILGYDGFFDFAEFDDEANLILSDAVLGTVSIVSSGVQSIALAAAGTGYESVPDVVISGTGFGATAQAVLNVGSGTGTVYVIEYVRSTNRFDTGREITDSSLLRVTLDGEWLTEERDYTVDGSVVVLRDPPIDAGQIVAITSLAQSVLPGEMKFRIFKDMRGTQTVYRMIDAVTTSLFESITPNDVSIQVTDASRLPQPDVDNNRFAFVSINGERVAYRGRDLATNTLTGVRRGVSGTAAAAHAVGSQVISMNFEDQLLPAYQDRVLAETYRDDVSTLDFVAQNQHITDQAQVYLGGTVSVSVGELASRVTTADGSTQTFQLPLPAGLDPEAIVGSDTLVSVDDDVLEIGVDYVLDSYTSGDLLRTVTLNTAPTAGKQVTAAVKTDLRPQDPSAYSVTGIDPVQITFVNTPLAGQLINLVINQIDGSTDVTSITATGTTAVFVSSSMLLQSVDDFTVLSYSPITVALQTVPQSGQIVLVTTQSSVQNVNAQFQIGNGTQSQFSTNIDLGRLISVTLAGSPLPSDAYRVIDVSPVTVRLNQELPPEQELAISVRQGRTWYRPGINTASNGVSLQIADTPAARFLRGSR